MNLYSEIRKGTNESFGASRIGWADIQAYEAVTGQKLTRKELRAITCLDDEYIAFMAEQNRKRQQ